MRAMYRGLTIGGLVLAGCAAEDPLPSACPAPAAAPAVELGGSVDNLVVISIDTLRRDALARYGVRDDAPFLDDLAARSLVLDDHASGSSWTYPSMMCALVGRCGEEFGAIPWTLEPAADWPPVPEDVSPLGEWLTEHGFTTSLISASPLLNPDLGLSRGMTRVETDIDAPAESIVDRALEEAAALTAGSAPWMLHVHLLDPHSPYQPPEPYLAEVRTLDPIPFDLDDADAWRDAAQRYTSLDRDTQALVRAHFKARYFAEVRYLDDQLARLWAGLEASGALDAAAVLVLSDHGEQFWEHHRWGHNVSLHYGERRALAMLWTPQITPAAWPQPTQHRDLLPTVLPLLGVPVPEGTSGVAVGSADPSSPRFAVTRPDDAAPLQAVDWQCFTLLYMWAGNVRLYRRDSDPGETVDRSADTPITAIALMEQLRPEIERLEAVIDSHTPLDPELVP